MPDNPHLDDAEAEALLIGALIPLLGQDPLHRFLQDARAVGGQPPPAPTAALARVLQSGFSMPSRPAPRRTKEKHHSTMSSPRLTSPRILRGLTGKILAVSTTVLIGVSTAAAAGALPNTVQHVVAEAVHSVSPLQLPDAQASTSASTSAAVNAGLGDIAAAHAGATVSGGAGAGTGTSTSGTGASAGAGLKAGANVNAAGVTAGVGVNAQVGAGTGHSGLSGTASSAAASTLATVSAATAQIGTCVSHVLSAATGQPLVAVTAVLPTLLACVQRVIAGLPVPATISSCVSGLVASLANLAVLGAANGLVKVTGCIPVDLAPCVQAALGAVGGALGGPSGSGIANLTRGISACASSIVTGVLNLVNGVLHALPGGINATVNAGGAATAHVNK